MNKKLSWFYQTCGTSCGNSQTVIINKVFEVGMRVIECNFPHESLVMNEAYAADFHDSYQLISDEINLDPLSIYLRMVNNTPIWVNILLSLRNKIVRLFGLKNVGNLGNLNKFTYNICENLIGAKLDIFYIEALNQDEMILVQKDKHLDVRLSILKRKKMNSCNIVLSSVNYHNFFGKIYMSAIFPFHKVIMKRMLTSLFM